MSNGTTILSDLQTRLLRNRPDAGTLVLDGATLPAGVAGDPDQILELIRQALKVSSLAISTATTPTLSSDQTTLDIEGQATILQADNCQVSIRFTVSATKTLGVYLRAALPSDWRFSTSFPALAATDLNYLSLSECLLLLTSYDHSESGVFFPLTRGLSFYAKLKLTNKLVPVTPDLTADFQTVAIGGAIDNSGETPQFTLTGERALSDLTFDVLSFGSMTMRNGQIAIVSANNGGTVKRQIRGPLGFALETGDFELDLPLTYPKPLNLTIAEPNYSLSNLSAATNLIGGASLTNYLPSQLTGMGAMNVSELLFQFKPGANDYSHAAIKISSGNQEPYHLIPSALSLREFSFGLAADTYVYYTGLVNRAYRGSIGGSFTLGDVDVTVTLTIPTEGDWIISLTQNSPQPTLRSVATFINQGISNIIGPLPDAIRSAIERAIEQLGSLAIKNVEIGVNVSQPSLSYVSFDIEQLEPWEIVSFLSVSGWKIQTLLTHAGGAWQTFGLLTGRIMIGPAGHQQPIDVRLPIPAGQEGWTISLAAEPFTIPDLTHICYLVGIGEIGDHLPKGLGEIGNLTVTHLDLIFDPALPNPVKGVIFTMHTNSPWNLIPNQGLVINNLLVSLWLHTGGQQSAYVTGIIKGTVTIFGKALFITAQRITQDKSWVFELSTLDYIHIPGLADLAAWMLPGEMVQFLPQSFMPFGQGFNLTELKLDFDLTTVRMTKLAFSIRNVGAWEVIPGYVVLDDVFVTADITQPGQAAQSSTVHIEGALTIAGVDIRLSADKPKSELNADNEWQFRGSTKPGQEIPIGRLIGDLVKSFGEVTLPSAIAKLVIENLSLTFNTKTKNLTFTCEAKFPVDDKQVDITVTIDITRVVDPITMDVTYNKTFGGRIMVGGLPFTLAFVQNKTSDLFIATFANTDNRKISIKSLIEEVSSGVAAYIPESLEIELKDVLFAFLKNSNDPKFLFGLDIGTDISLSELPLVGQKFPRDQKVGVDDLQLLVASKPLSRDEVTSLNNIIKTIPGVATLPVPPQGDGAETGATIIIPDGLTVSAKMIFGKTEDRLSLPVAGGTPEGAVNNQPATTAAPVTTDKAKWFTLQKTFGPVTFNRVGIQYQDQALWFLLDAALSMAGLTLSLDGLSVGSPLNKFEPKFNLRGLGIDYSNGPVEIGGAFLRTQVQVGGKTYDEYDGTAVIKTAQFALSAIGSYADLDGHPSLFIYAVLDYPLGGPSFFFVTGLAAGFGYNRSLLMPTIDQVAQFPLVAQAVSGQRAPNNLSTELQSLQRYIPPSVGDVFFAVGVKFTSFKIIDSFVLVTVLFGSRFELNLLGLSTLISPPQTPANVPPLSVVQMAVRASFLPDEGFLGVQAQLTSASYIFTRDCHLTGGFAFFSWFKGDHAGDFVLTLGGYHPNYNLPSHYPRVPRVGISWQVNRNLSIKGSAYFALTASALMAGGSLQATWVDGNLRAWFNAVADFIVSWKPYHYDARVYVNMGVSYTFNVDLWFTTITKTISVDVGADLHIWGPEFSGTAHIKLWIVSFDVTFGSGASQRPQAIGWNEFRTSFIPDKDEDVCSVAITRGLVKTTEDKKWIVNPKDFCLVTNSVIPSKSASAGGLQLRKGATEFGVGPMEVSSDNLDTSHTITLSRIVNSVKEPASDKFVFDPILKKVPAGLWGKSLTPSLNGQSFIDSALSGFEITPKNPPTPGHTSEIARANLMEAAREVPHAYGWEPFKPFTAQQAGDDARREAIRASLSEPGTTSARNRLLNDLGIAGEMNPPPAIASVFTVPPQVGELSR